MLSQSLIQQLHTLHCSCVIRNGEHMLTCHARGVKDLHSLLHNSPQLLLGAEIADKVVGKGAAALMVVGGVKWVYADVISRGALDLLQNAGIETHYDTMVDNIINRSGDDICPVEKLCAEATSAEQCIPLINQFIEKMA